MIDEQEIFEAVFHSRRGRHTGPLRRTKHGHSVFQTPIVKIAVGVVFYNAWWSIEEFVIDRHGLGK